MDLLSLAVQPMLMYKYDPDPEPFPLDVLTLTASEAILELRSGRITSVDLVKAYLAQIHRHNHRGARLNAVINTVRASQIIREAAFLDDIRASGEQMSVMHGIPFMVDVRRNSSITARYLINVSVVADVTLGLDMDRKRIWSRHHLWHRGLGEHTGQGECRRCSTGKYVHVLGRRRVWHLEQKRD